MEQMETIMFNKDEMNALEDSISAEGDFIVFTQHETERSGRDYLIACSQNDKDERAHRAEVMKDASRIVIF
jgi:predicted HicB family RNase H-like nuclease